MWLTDRCAIYLHEILCWKWGKTEKVVLFLCSFKRGKIFLESDAISPSAPSQLSHWKRKREEKHKHLQSFLLKAVNYFRRNTFWYLIVYSCLGFHIYLCGIKSRSKFVPYHFNMWLKKFLWGHFKFCFHYVLTKVFKDTLIWY